MLCRLAHAHRPDAVLKADFDTAFAAHHIKESLVLVKGGAVVVAGIKDRGIDRHLMGNRIAGMTPALHQQRNGPRLFGADQNRAGPGIFTSSLP